MDVKIGKHLFSIVNISIFIHIFSLYFLYTSITSIYTYIFAIISILCIFIKYGFNDKLDICSQGYFVFVLFCLFSVSYAVDKATSIKRVGLLTLICINLIALNKYSLWEENLEHIKKCFILMGPLLVVYVFFKSGINITNNFRYGYGIINENTMAFQLMISISFTLKRSGLSNWNKFTVILIILDIAGIFLCGSRAVYVALFFDVLLTYTMAYKLKKSIINISLSAIVFIIILLIVYQYSNTNIYLQVALNRLTSVFDILKGESGDLSVVSREKMILFGFEAFLKKPIFGYGIDSFKELYPLKRTYAHNNYIELLVDGGIVGLLIYYSIFFKLIMKTYKSWKLTKVQSYLPLLIAVLIMGMGSVYYDLATVMYILVVSNKSSDFAFKSNKVGNIYE